MSTRDSKAQAKIKQQLLDLLKLPENKYCAECGMKQPRWASYNLGVFICIKCSGIHRSIGVHITKVRSVTLDTWTQEMADVIANIGNEKANAYWEYNLPEGRKPGPNDTTYAIESFIKDKYNNKRFVKKGAEPPSGKSSGTTKKSKAKKKVDKEEPEPKEESEEEEEVSTEEEEEQKPKKPTKKPTKKQEAKATEPTKKPSPKVTKEVEVTKEVTKPKEVTKKEVTKKEVTKKEVTKEDDLLTFNNWAETMPTGTDEFGSFFSPEPPKAAPAPAPTPAAPAKPAPDIMSLFKTPQPSFANPYPQVGSQPAYGYSYSQPVPPYPTSYVPPHIATGGPMASTPRRKVNSTNDVMALF